MTWINIRPYFSRHFVQEC
uniref:Uncharacterized protein n=1 Tax=Anguilla anguilla TaxID=7936 RepID=A0A0E9TZH1_ANGAN